MSDPDRLTRLRHHLQRDRRDWKAIRELLVEWIEDPDSDLKIGADYVLQALKQVDDRAKTMDRIFRSEQEIVRLREENKRLKDAALHTPRRDQARTGPVNERRRRAAQEGDSSLPRDQLRNLWSPEISRDLQAFHGIMADMTDRADTGEVVRVARAARADHVHPGPQQRTASQGPPPAEAQTSDLGQDEMDLLESLWSGDGFRSNHL